MSNLIENKKWSNALTILAQHGFTDIVSMNLDKKGCDMYKIKHKYKETIIVPYVAIEENFHFLLEKDNNPKVLTGDNVQCIATNVEEKPIFDLAEDIENIYKITPYNFLLTWHKANLGMSDLTMVKMNLKKIEK